MSQPLINLVLPLVDRELENLSWAESGGNRAISPRHLEAYHLRQELQDYVLQRVPACYARVEEDGESIPNLNLIPRSLHQQIRSAIVEWMQHVASKREQFSAPFPRRTVRQLVA